MAAKGYTTKAQIENYILSDIDVSFDTQIQSWIENVETIIDKLTGRNFIADSTASARLYDGDDTDTLLIDDCVVVSKVEIGQDSYGESFTEILATGADKYFLEPANYAANKVPIRKISLSAREFISGRQNQRITAKWGYSATVPADIAFVATVFVAGIINQHRQGGDEIKTEKIGDYSVTYNTDNQSNSWADFERAKEILDAYKKVYI